jgi:hypothetical protein
MKAEVDKKIEMKAAAEELQQNQRDIEKTAKAATKEIKNVIQKQIKGKGKEKS